MVQDAKCNAVPTTELRIPKEFTKYEDVVEAEVIVRLEQWKERACEALSALRDQVCARVSVPPKDQGEIVYYTAAFDGDGPWILGSSRKTAQEVLSSFEKPGVELLECVLRVHVKPIFLSNPHPQINVDTGRKLPRTAGGPLGHLDYFEEQGWKSHPGLYNVLSWCLRNVDDRAVERLWHLFVPPIMTYLDDYQAPYKLQGVRLVSQLLQCAPSELLRRTGMDVLLSASLKTCFNFLHERETPDLIRASVSSHIQLINATTIVGSASRFDQLCSLLGESIIGNIWIYASREPEALQASVDCIPAIVESLGIGATRYLKALIPQLVFPLIPAPENGSSVSYKLSSIRTLHSVIQNCEPRIYKWRGTILEAIVKCWVDVGDSGLNDTETLALKDELRAACIALTHACRDTAPQITVELQSIQSLDKCLFTPLLVDSLGCEHAH
ncbi:hypothetical protein GY45DRAFT_1065421 [Cubamyces sp. BRFM 1775]|nr:hypothetical protein GY45DRAFT_1065421 [Cubamyces sp. BRFM 1775]